MEGYHYVFLLHGSLFHGNLCSMINVQVSNKNNENSMNVIRRFTRRVNSSGILNRARSLRYHSRDFSDTVQKKQALRSLKRRGEVERLIKLGKLPDRRRHAVGITDEKE
jgi:ribosomal protein S21